MILIEVNNVNAPPSAVIELTKGELLFMREAYDCYGATSRLDGQYDIAGAATTGSIQIDEILSKMEKST